MMPIEAELQTYLRCWSNVARLARRPMLFLPFALIALVKVALLGSIYFFWDPRISGFMVPAMRSLGGEKLLHYPAHIEALPGAFSVAEMTIMILFGFAVVCGAVLMMVDTLDGRRHDVLKYAGEVVLATPAIAVFAVCFEGAAVGVPAALRTVADGFAERPKIQLVLLAGSYAAALVATSMLVFAPCLLRVAKGNVLSALKKSARMARSNALAVFLSVGTVLFLDAVLDLLASLSSSAVGGPRADSVASFLLLKIFVGLFGWFYLFGSAASIATSSDWA